MKKLLIGLLTIVLCVTLVGCTKEENEGKWVMNKEEVNVTFSEEVQKILDNVLPSYRSAELKPVALLGRQVVAGTNYMFLCKTEVDGETIYKMIVVYNDLEGYSTITYNNDFDVTKYAGKEISLEAEELVGGWEATIDETSYLEEKVQTTFNEATSKIIGVTYYPITVLATSNNNYAILCFGKMADQNGTVGVYVVTLNADKSEISSIAAVDLKEYNK